MSDYSLLSRVRPSIVALKAYASARSLYTATGDTVFLDANEMAAEAVIGHSDYGRYGAQQPTDLLDSMATLYGVKPENLMVSRGADEAIEILIRVFCEPNQDSILICPPTFPMYAQSAAIHGAAIQTVSLNPDFFLDTDAVLDAVQDTTKLVFICSPNNPTASLVPLATIEHLCKQLQGKALVVVDEAYIEFSGQPSAICLLEKYENVAVLRTLSKAYALAGVRCGSLIAAKPLIDLCRKVLPPYPLPVPAVTAVLKTLEPENKKRLEKAQQESLEIRDWFASELQNIDSITHIFPSYTNFLLVKTTDADKVYQQCLENGFVLRNQSHQPSLENCLRISICTQEQMEGLLSVLKTGKKPEVALGRTASIVRTTKETAIRVTVNLDKTSPVRIHTGLGFHDHMLEQIARHGGFSLVLDCTGDLHIDGHHTIEDCAIALGQAIRTALGSKIGLERFGFSLPMDEASANVLIDLSGRAYLKFDGTFPASHVGDLPTDMVEHIFRSLADNLQANIHVSVTGENSHHMVEACFKAFGRALRQAIRVSGTELPTTKGVL